MSRKNNLNPDYYKTAGRGRQGDAIDQVSHRQKFTEEEARRTYGGASAGDALAAHANEEQQNEERPQRAQDKRGVKARDSMPSRSVGREAALPHRQQQKRKKAGDVKPTRGAKRG